MKNYLQILRETLKAMLSADVADGRGLGVHHPLRT